MLGGMMTRRRVFGALWLAWLAAFVCIELAALATCEGGTGAAGCTFSAVIWRTTADPIVWALMAAGLAGIGAHLLSRGRF